MVDELELVIVVFIGEVEEDAVVLVVEREVIESQNSSRIGPIHPIQIGQIVQVVNVCVMDDRQSLLLGEDKRGP